MSDSDLSGKALLHQTIHWIGSWFEDKKHVIDPLSSVIRLAIYSFKPEKTKLGMSENIIWYHSPSLYQGLARSFYGDKKDDLHNLHVPIKMACKWCLSDTPSSNNPFNNQQHLQREEARIIFDLAVKGLDKLKRTYKKYPLVVLCSQYYANIIKAALENTTDSDSGSDLNLDDIEDDLSDIDLQDSMMLKESLRESFKESTINKEMYNEVLAQVLRQVWTDEKFSVVCTMLKDAVKLREDGDERNSKSVVQGLEHYLQPIDDEINEAIKNIRT